MNSYKNKIQNQVSHLLIILQSLLETFSEPNSGLHALIEGTTTQKVEGRLKKVIITKKKSKQNVEINNQKKVPYVKK